MLEVGGKNAEAKMQAQVIQSVFTFPTFGVA